jgi:DNA-binding response OmpR family regulator
MHLALIEDNVSLARLITAILQFHGKSVRHFLDGISFLTSLQTTSYDFVLVDFNLPGTVSGLQVITFLQESMPTVPVLVISGAHESLLTRLQILYPHLSILSKPFSLLTLLQSIETAQRLP